MAQYRLYKSTPAAVAKPAILAIGGLRCFQDAIIKAGINAKPVGRVAVANAPKKAVNQYRF